MFSKLRYPNALVDSTINKFRQKTDTEPHAATLSEPSVYMHFIALQRSTISQSRPQRNSFSGMQDQHRRKTRLYQRKTVADFVRKEKQAPDRKHTMRCIFISM